MTDLDAAGEDVDDESLDGADLAAAEIAIDAMARDLEVSREEAVERLIVALAAASDVDVAALEEGRTDAVEEELDTIEERVDAVEKSTPEADELDRLRSVLSRLGETTERLEATVDGLEANVNDLEADLESLEADIEGVETNVDDLGVDVDEKIEDVRNRLVRIYRDVESKAPADHGHPEIEDAIGTLDATVSDADDRVDELDTTIEKLTARQADLEDTLDDFETRYEDVSGKLSRVASAVVRVQQRLKPIERHVAEERRLAELTATANRHGVRKADCEDCGDTVLLSLLTTPDCPHCGERFRDIDPNTGFFGTSTLLVGDPPALEGDTRDPGDLTDTGGSSR